MYYKVSSGLSVEPVLPLVPQYKGSRIAPLAETSNAESPTIMYI